MTRIIVSLALFIALTGGAPAAQEPTENCLSADLIDDWRAYDDDTLSVFGNGHELARIEVAMIGPSDTWMMHLIHVARFEAGDDGLLCPRGSDTLVLDGRRHLIDVIILIDSAAPEPDE